MINKCSLANLIIIFREQNVIHIVKMKVKSVYGPIKQLMERKSILHVL